MHEVETQLNQLSGSNQDLSPGGVKENLRHSTSDLSMASDSTGKQKKKKNLVASRGYLQKSFQFYMIMIPLPRATKITALNFTITVL